MADYIRRTVTTTRQEYALRSPTNWAEVEKVLAAVKRDLSTRSTYDDTVQIEARDDEVVFWFEVRSWEAGDHAGRVAGQL